MPEQKIQKLGAFRSLTITLAIVFLSLSVVILLISGGLQMYFNFRAQQEIIASEQDFIAEDAANTVRRFIQEKFSVLETIARVIDIDRPEEQKQTLGSLMVEPAFRQLVLLNTKEEELMKVSRLSQFELGCLRGGIRSELFFQVSQGKEYIGSVCIDEITNEPMVIMAVPVINTLGYFQGVLTAEVNLKFMWDLVARLKIGENGLAYVVDKQGNLIAFSDVSRVLKSENLSHLKEVSEFIKGNILTHKSTANISKGIQGTYVVANYAHLGEPDWAVMIELPAVEAYQTVIYGVGLSVVVIVFCIILAIAVGISLSRRITKPIISLRNAAIEISKGKLDTKIEIQTKDEIGELAQTFNQMASTLKELYETLEGKVQERTKELEEARASLEIRVKARTRELKELTERQEEIIEKRTKEIQERMKELERFHRLAVGRELKMIEMKKEMQKLKEELGKNKEKYE
jgi:HAMP domain-containing protein